MNIILSFFLFFLLAAPTVNAAHKHAQERQVRDGADKVCCHYCRISEKRKRKKAVEYVSCKRCQHRYCENCLNKKVDGLTKKMLKRGDPCLVCTKECCCLTYNCTKAHTHCFTYKRTQRRHAAKEHKWVKEKLPQNLVKSVKNEVKTEEYEDEPRPKKRIKTEAKRPPKKKRPRESSESDFEEPVKIKTGPSEVKKGPKDKKRPLKKIRVVKKEHAVAQKTDLEVFGDLKEAQDFHAKCKLTDFKPGTNSREISVFSNAYFNDFIDIMGLNKSNKENHEPLAEFYNLAENNVKAFVDHLVLYGLGGGSLDKIDSKNADLSGVMDGYNKLFSEFFISSNSDENEEGLHVGDYLASAAAKFFRYCFVDSYAEFVSLLKKRACWPALRLLQSVIIENLAKGGWIHWSENILAELAEHSSDNKRVYYLAGGLDIHALIDSGIYNVTIVDPFLPTQEKFYTDSWRWFIEESAIGDEVIFENQRVLLKKIFVVEKGIFDGVVNDDQKISLMSTSSTWHVIDLEGDQKVLGTLEIERRNCTVEDFKEQEDKIILMSFNEFSYLSADAQQWGIDISQIDPKTPIYIKQLPSPISMTAAHNMKSFNKLPFKFVQFASDVN